MRQYLESRLTTNSPFSIRYGIAFICLICCIVSGFVSAQEIDSKQQVELDNTPLAPLGSPSAKDDTAENTNTSDGGLTVEQFVENEDGSDSHKKKNGDEAGAKVLVFVDSVEHRQMAQRVCMELIALGFDAQIGEGTGEEDTPDEIGQLAQTHKAAAAIQIELSQKTVGVWVADRITGKIVFRTIAIEEGNEPQDTVIAIAAVELLRASLMELHSPHPPKGEVEATPKVELFSKPIATPSEEPKKETRHHRLFLDMGAGVTFVDFNMNPSMPMTVSCYYKILKWLRVGIMGLIPLLRSKRELDEGEYTIAPGILGAEALTYLGDDRKRVQMVLGPGLGVGFFSVKGFANEGYVSKDELLVTVVPYLRTGISVTLTSTLALRADMVTGWATVSNVVEVADSQVTELGRPWMSLLASMEISIW